MKDQTDTTPDPGESSQDVTTPTQQAAGRSTTSVLLGIFGLAAVVLVLDQLAKMWAQSALVLGEPARPLLGELVQLRLIYNPGAALGLASGATWLLTALSAGVVVFVVVTARKIQSRAWGVALGLVLGGALGNLVDRLLRDPGFPNGHVVDFIDYGPFIGNVADIAIVVAAVYIGWLALRGIGPDGVRESERTATETGVDAPAADADGTAGPAGVAADATDRTAETVDSPVADADGAAVDADGAAVPADDETPGAAR